MALKLRHLPRSGEFSIFLFRLINGSPGSVATSGRTAACGFGRGVFQAFTADPHVTTEADHRIAGTEKHGRGRNRDEEE